MKTQKLFYLILVPALLLGSCQKSPGPEPGPKVISLDQKSLQLLQTSNDFAFDIFNKVVSFDEDKGNLMISPLSISLALAMTYNGADGTTKEAFEKTLHLNGLSVEEINQSYQSLVNALLSVDPKVIMEIANSIWYRNDFSVEDSFLNINKNYYNSEVRKLNFSDPASVDIINSWVSDKTHEKIGKIIDKIEPANVMFLINAVYFKGIWKYQFNKEDTKEEPFFDKNGNLFKNVQMMSFKEKINYTSNDLLRAIDLPYGQGNFSMSILLPDYGISADSIISSMNKDSWSNLINSFSNDTEVNVYLPKFKIEYKKELIPDLTQLGMGVAFSGGADFTKINKGGNLYISSVKHKTFIEVDEEGTEAAAVTSVTISYTSAGGGGDGSIEFRADHPYIFVIREQTTGAILFMGKVIEPETE